MDTAAVLAALDEDLRRACPAAPGAVVERTAFVTRHVDDRPHGWSAVVWSDVDESSADRVISEEISRFRRSAGHHEWKHYDHDGPLDLPERLRGAGLRADGHEAVMVVEAALVPEHAPPPGLRVVRVRDDAGVARAVGVHDGAFGGDSADLGARLREAVRTAPDALDVVLAVTEDGEAVAAARTEYHPGTAFAGLWGGGTLPAWRGRGVYRALVSARARLAVARGARWLQVDAAPTSEPILRRMGFTAVTGTTAYVLPDGAGA